MQTCKSHPTVDPTVVPSGGCFKCWQIYKWNQRQLAISRTGQPVGSAPVVKTGDMSR